MDQAGLLRCIAEAGYNVGYGAKKHFATFDMIEKLPGWIGFLSLAAGIFGLIFEPLSSKVPSAWLAVLGIGALYMSFYRGAEYDVAGKALTGIFTQLRDLYWSVKGGADVDTAHAQLKRLDQEAQAAALSKQIFLSGWYAHYKFFSEAQIGWIDEQLHFKWTDKVPLSARVVGPLLLVVLVALLIWLAVG